MPPTRKKPSSNISNNGNNKSELKSMGDMAGKEKSSMGSNKKIVSVPDKNLPPANSKSTTSADSSHVLEKSVPASKKKRKASDVESISLSSSILVKGKKVKGFIPPPPPPLDDDEEEKQLPKSTLSSSPTVVEKNSPLDKYKLSQSDFRPATTIEMDAPESEKEATTSLSQTSAVGSDYKLDALTQPKSALNTSPRYNTIDMFKLETSRGVNQLHEALNRNIEDLNTKVANEYASMNKEAETEILDLKKRIETIITRTSLRQQTLYEDLRQKIMECKDKTNEKIHQLVQERTKELQKLIGKKGLLPENDLKVSHESSLANVKTQVESTASSGGTRVHCAQEGCQKRPSCNFSGLQHAQFCGQHKLPGMINVTVKRCEAEGCSRMPGYNFEGLQERRFCIDHKLDGMVNISSALKKKTRVNENSMLPTINPLCETTKCENLAKFNYSGQLGRRFCEEHMHQGMVNLERELQGPNIFSEEEPSKKKPVASSTKIAESKKK